MAIIKQLNKKTGITYVYESRSYRDKDTKQPRSERKLIGRIDDATGEIIPTRKKQKNITTSDYDGAPENTKGIPESVDVGILREKEAIIMAQQKEIDRLRKEKAETTAALEKLLSALRS